jgi:hypothetical protein
MDENYKSHHIQSTARPILESGRWVPHVIITWMSGSGEKIREFEVKRGFATEEDAQQAGLTFARNWIDQGKPRID